MQSAGIAGELSAPLVDVRGWYVLAALTRSEGVFGILYVDEHRNAGLRPFESSLVRTLATIAAVSIDNSMLYAQTRELAMRDPLTGLYNRRASPSDSQARSNAASQTADPFTYVMIDLDDFKRLTTRSAMRTATAF
jgi:GGDEF domain-containing protein